MVSNIGKLLKYNSKGCKLLRKSVLGLKDVQMPKNLIPENANVVENVKVLTDYGKNVTNVYSFRDANHNLLRRVIVKNVDGKEVSKMVRSYQKDCGVLFTDTKFFTEDKFTHGKREIFEAKPQENKLDHVKLEYVKNKDGSRCENQVYETLMPKVKDEKLTTTATRLNDGKIVDTKINGKSEVVSQVKDDPYLFIRNYDNEDFIQSASHYAQKQQIVSGQKGELHIKEIPKENWLGFYSDSSRSVTIDPKKQYTKMGFVDTLNHEYRHKWQHGLIRKYLSGLFNPFKKDGEKVILDKSQKELVPRLIQADLLYPFTTINKKIYYNNFLEVDARKAGKKAADEYLKHSCNLAKTLDISPDMTYSGLVLDKALLRIIKMLKQREM